MQLDRLSHSSRLRRRALACLISGIVLAGCGKQEPADTAGAEPTMGMQGGAEQVVAESKTIPWFEGSIEAAFAEAGEAGKPLFLYWGAIWCPPCEQIKQTVFKHPAFLEQVGLFIPVYLDGDTERAQSWGEQFAVAGYPTMIVFSPQGDEVTRIPGWIDSQQYINTLQLALDGLQSTPELLARALKGEPLSADAYSQLAYYSWDQANLPDSVAPAATELMQLAEAAETAGNSLAASRLFLQYLYMLKGEAQAAGAEVIDGDLPRIRQELTELLASRETVMANSDYLLILASDLVPLVTADDASRTHLTEAWVAAMADLRGVDTVSAAERLATWFPVLNLYWQQHEEAEALPPEMLAAVTTSVAEADAATTGEARQTVINEAYQLLALAKQVEQARDMLLREVETSYAPYYFMSGLGDLEQDLGNIDQAVEWHRRAYENADGPATRFQWGFQYVASLIELKPEQHALIADSSNGLLDELGSPSDVFSGRNYGRLTRLLDRLSPWEEAEMLESPVVAKLDEFTQRLETACQTLAPDSLAADNCAQWKAGYSRN